MAGRSSFQSRLSSIMETMAKSALGQVCKLVDEDSAKLQRELSRLLVTNSALAEKVNTLECELTVVRRNAPKLSKSYRNVGVQTIYCRDEDACDVSRPLTIEGIFGKDWCMNLWKGKDPYSLQLCTNSQPAHTPDESIGSLSDQISITEVKEEEYVQHAATLSQQETLITEDHESLTEDGQDLTVDYTVDGSTCSLSFDQDGEQIVSSDDIEEQTVQLISMNDAEQAFSTHIIPIDDEDEEDEEEEEEEEEEDEEDDDDDVQFVQASKQELAVNAAFGLSHSNQQTLPTDSTENCALEKDSHDDFSRPDVETTECPSRDKFTCQICNRTFFHKGTLTRHMKSHKSNFCNICKQHLHHKSKLSSHRCVPPVPVKRVSKSCELCGKAFANPSALRIHYVVHTGEKPYRCSMCDKRFTQKGNLKCHLRIHTGEKPFRCVKCGKTFTQKVNLNHHLMAHLNREVPGETPAVKKQFKT